MLEAETSSLVQSLHDRITLGRPVVTLKDLLAADIPGAVQRMIRIEIESKLQEEQQILFSESDFNYSHPDVHHLREQMNSALVLQYVFTGNQLHEILEEQVGLLMRYLIRPEATLRAVIFEHGHVSSTTALDLHLRSFEAYDYLGTILREYLRGRGISSISADRFAKLLRGIDAEYVRRKTGEQLAQLLVPLTTLLTRHRTDPPAPLPIDALIEFFYDKGLLAVCVKLENLRNEGTFSLPVPELAGVLENVRLATGEFKTDETVPKHGVQEQKEETRPVPAEPVPELRPRPSPPAAPSRSFDIEDSERRKFIRKVFDGDEVAYDTALHTLTAAQNWKDASRAIDQIFLVNRIYPFTSDAKRFVKVIARQFNS